MPATIVDTVKEINSIVGTDRSAIFGIHKDNDLYWVHRLTPDKGNDWVYVSDLEKHAIAHANDLGNDVSMYELRSEHVILKGASPLGTKQQLLAYWHALYLMVVPRVAEFEKEFILHANQDDKEKIDGLLDIVSSIKNKVKRSHSDVWDKIEEFYPDYVIGFEHGGSGLSVVYVSPNGDGRYGPITFLESVCLAEGGITALDYNKTLENEMQEQLPVYYSHDFRVRNGLDYGWSPHCLVVDDNVQPTDCIDTQIRYWTKLAKMIGTYHEIPEFAPEFVFGAGIKTEAMLNWENIVDENNRIKQEIVNIVDKIGKIHEKKVYKKRSRQAFMACYYDWTWETRHYGRTPGPKYEIRKTNDGTYFVSMADEPNYKYTDEEETAYPMWLEREALREAGVILKPGGDPPGITKSEQVDVRNAGDYGSDCVPKHQRRPIRIHYSEEYRDKFGLETGHNWIMPASKELTILRDYWQHILDLERSDIKEFVPEFILHTPSSDIYSKDMYGTAKRLKKGDIIALKLGDDVTLGKVTGINRMKDEKDVLIHGVFMRLDSRGIHRVLEILERRYNEKKDISSELATYFDDIRVMNRKLPNIPEFTEEFVLHSQDVPAWYAIPVGTWVHTKPIGEIVNYEDDPGWQPGMGKYTDVDARIERYVFEPGPDRYIYYLISKWDAVVPMGWDSRWFDVKDEVIPEYAEEFVLHAISDEPYPDGTKVLIKLFKDIVNYSDGPGWIPAMKEYCSAYTEISESNLGVDTDRWEYSFYDLPYVWDSRWFYVPGESGWDVERIPEFTEEFVLHAGSDVCGEPYPDGTKILIKYFKDISHYRDDPGWIPDMENYCGAYTEITSSNLGIDTGRWEYHFYDLPYAWDARWFYVPGESGWHDCNVERVPEYAEEFVLAPMGKPVITLDYIVNTPVGKGPGKRSGLTDFLICGDDTKMSVQASAMHYCLPRDDEGPWTKVEVGPLDSPSPEMLKYAEEPGSPSTIYPYVPVDVVARYIRLHSGLKEFEPEFILHASDKSSFEHGVTGNFDDIQERRRLEDELTGLFKRVERNVLRNMVPAVKDKEQDIRTTKSFTEAWLSGSGSHPHYYVAYVEQLALENGGVFNGDYLDDWYVGGYFKLPIFIDEGFRSRFGLKRDMVSTHVHFDHVGDRIPDNEEKIEGLQRLIRYWQELERQSRSIKVYEKEFVLHADGTQKSINMLSIIINNIQDIFDKDIGMMTAKDLVSEMGWSIHYLKQVHGLTTNQRVKYIITSMLDDYDKIDTKLRSFGNLEGDMAWLQNNAKTLRDILTEKGEIPTYAPRFVLHAGDGNQKSINLLDIMIGNIQEIFDKDIGMMTAKDLVAEMDWGIHDMAEVQGWTDNQRVKDIITRILDEYAKIDLNLRSFGNLEGDIAWLQNNAKTLRDILAEKGEIPTYAPRFVLHSPFANAFQASIIDKSMSDEIKDFVLHAGGDLSENC